MEGLDIRKVVAVAVSIIEEEQGIKIDYEMVKKEEKEQEASA